MRIHTHKKNPTHFYRRNQLQQDLETILYLPNTTQQTNPKISTEDTYIKFTTSSFHIL